MKVLKAIGGFFCKIGRWIRDTAWVQPLLIVGGIFAIIFSIPYIVDAVEANFEGGDEASAYYEKYQLSLEGSQEGKSEAHDLFNYIKGRQEGNLDKDAQKKYGDQFFVTFVSDNCAGCKDVYPAFQTMEQKMSDKTFVAAEGRRQDFKLYTIDINQSTDDKLEGSETAFSKYFFNDNLKFFEDAATATADNPYYTNNGGATSEGYGKLLENLSDLSAFPTPTTFMFDFSYQDDYSITYGITDILFNFEGKNNETSSYALALTLLDCWNHEGVFNEID